MHSCDELQSSSFKLTVDGQAVSHADFFREFTMRDRLALYAPGGIDGAGAANLLMAYVTAFYDDCRAGGENFFAYPDFFALCGGDKSPPSHMMFDVYPDHKTVHIGPEVIDLLRAATDRGVNVLLVPDGALMGNFSPQTDRLDELALHSARRNIRTCYAYSFDGQVRDADITITCYAKPLVDWMKMLFDSVVDDDLAAARGRVWMDKFAGSDKLVQSFRRIELDELLELN
jgi:hypothetical protein